MDLELAPDHDPLASERVYFRSKATGDRGYVVRREGREVIRLDRPMQEIIFPKTGDWIEDETATLILPMQAVQVAFAADRQACLALGLHGDSRVTWQDLTDAKRIDFAKYGPSDKEHPMREAVYVALRDAMRPYVR